MEDLLAGEIKLFNGVERYIYRSSRYLSTQFTVMHTNIIAFLLSTLQFPRPTSQQSPPIDIASR